jgi:uncharacterized protein (DUF1778 family)
MRRKNDKPESGSDPLDQVNFALDEQQSEEFAKVLAESPAPNPKLKDLMARKVPWEG